LGVNYRRVRIGIGHPGDKERVHGHVLGDFTVQDQTWLNALDEACVKSARWLVMGDDNRFISDVMMRIAPYIPHQEISPSSPS
jgi:PTH1 family peptidyl-tRNA hydrolase